MIEPLYCIPSMGRCQNVPVMQSFMPDAIWFVPADEVGDYRYCGARQVVACGPGLAVQLNCALETAFAQGRPCVHVDDDLKSLAWTDDWVTRRRISMDEVARRVLERLEGRGLNLGGAPPTDNMRFLKHEDTTHLHVQGSLTVVRPNPLRYDETVQNKTDLDYSMAHIVTYGGCLRVNNIVARFLHMGNRGGLTGLRTTETEQADGLYLAEKWGLHPGFQTRHWRKHLSGFYSKGLPV